MLMKNSKQFKGKGSRDFTTPDEKRSLSCSTHQNLTISARYRKPGWEAIRPETYNRKAPEEEESIYELLQTIKWRKSRFYEEKYRELRAS